MKNIFLASLCFALSFSVMGQNIDQEKERQRIADSGIKQATQWTHRYTGDKLNPKGSKTSVTQYDKNGNAIEIQNFRSNGSVSSRMLYKYNDANQRIEYAMYQDPDRQKLKLTYKQTIHYDKDGIKTQEAIFDGATGYRINYKYYPNGKLNEIVKMDMRGKVEERWVYAYKDNVHEISIFKPDKVLSSRMIKKTDANENLISDIRLDSKGNEFKKTEQEFDANDNLIFKTEYFSEKLGNSIEYKYNNDNRVVEVIKHFPDGSKFTQSQYDYDERGSLIEERWSENKSQEFSHKQSRFSDKGNVIETDSYFAPYRYRVLYKYTYEFY